MKTNWLLLHHGIGPSLLISALPGWSESFSRFHQHWNTSPKIGLYGFLATALLRLAWNDERYHLTICTIRSFGVSNSAALRKIYEKPQRRKKSNQLIIWQRLMEIFTNRRGRNVRYLLCRIIHLSIMYERTYLRNTSGWAKQSAYISSKERLSKINVGSTTLVRSIPIFTCEIKCLTTDPCDSTKTAE